MNTQLSFSFNEQPMKYCYGCKRILALDCFGKNKSNKDNLSYHCRECRKQYSLIHKKELAEYNKQWALKNKDKLVKYYQDHKEEYAERSKQWRQKNRKKVNELSRQYHQNNPEKRAKTMKKWAQNHKEYINNHQRQRMKNPKFKLNRNITKSIHSSLKARNISKNNRPWESLVNFTLQELMIRLESLFQDGMIWENQGEWHLDHIKPISLFDFESMDDPGFKECWALENLQPLWAEDNLRKSNKYI